MDDGKIKIDIFKFMQDGFVSLEKKIEALNTTLTNNYVKKEELQGIHERLLIVEKTMVTKEDQINSFWAKVGNKVLNFLINAVAASIAFGALVILFKEQLRSILG